MPQTCRGTLSTGLCRDSWCVLVEGPVGLAALPCAQALIQLLRSRPLGSLLFESSGLLRSRTDPISSRFSIPDLSNSRCGVKSAEQTQIAFDLEKGMATHSCILPGEFYGQRSLAGYSPWTHIESDTTEQLTLSLSRLQACPWSHSLP